MARQILLMPLMLHEKLEILSALWLISREKTSSVSRRCRPINQYLQENKEIMCSLEAGSRRAPRNASCEAHRRWKSQPTIN